MIKVIVIAVLVFIALVDAWLVIVCNELEKKYDKDNSTDNDSNSAGNDGRRK